jgi:hypothetical protein
MATDVEDAGAAGATEMDGEETATGLGAVEVGVGETATDVEGFALGTEV